MFTGHYGENEVHVYSSFLKSWPIRPWKVKICYTGRQRFPSRVKLLFFLFCWFFFLIFFLWWQISLAQKHKKSQKIRHFVGKSIQLFSKVYSQSFFNFGQKWLIWYSFSTLKTLPKWKIWVSLNHKWVFSFSHWFREAPPCTICDFSLWWQKLLPSKAQKISKKSDILWEKSIQLFLKVYSQTCF